MIYATQFAKQHMPDWSPKVGGKFEPSLLNTVVFLVSTVQSVSVFVVNYKGRPFMQSLTTNGALLYSLGLCGLGVFIASTEAMPVFNKILQCVPFPNEEFTNTIFCILIFNVVSTFLWDLFMNLVFTPQILFTCLRSISRQDIYSVAKMLVFMFILIHFFTPTEEGYQQIKKHLAEQGL
eukprot:TRINITY_DN6553_c0_g1_i2.p1 TRINITY_DN6553_c0_g1~~TRINITY_DN6553_c0_g1_i2.p1  ORF type:complete len:195 (+),score=45.30 TRINITY_DN6553_c0_g1_i2:50-586(+)